MLHNGLYQEMSIMSAIRISRPRRAWSVAPATVLPAGLLLRLIRPHWNFTVLLDDHPAGKIGNEQVKVFTVDPGEHRLRMRFLLLRRSEEMRMSLKEDEEREFICGSNGIGWPTLREASPEEGPEGRGASIREPSDSGDSAPPS